MIALGEKSTLCCPMKKTACENPTFTVEVWTVESNYGHKALILVLINVRDPIHADSLALFSLGIDILLSKPKKSNILNLT